MNFFAGLQRIGPGFFDRVSSFFRQNSTVFFLNLVFDWGFAGADLPVFDAALPLDELLLHFGAPFALVDQVGDAAHRVQGLRHQRTVRVIFLRRTQ